MPNTQELTNASFWQLSVSQILAFKLKIPQEAESIFKGSAWYRASQTLVYPIALSAKPTAGGNARIQCMYLKKLLFHAILHIPELSSVSDRKDYLLLIPDR